MTNDGKKENRIEISSKENYRAERTRIKSKHFGIGGSGDGGSEALKCAYIILKWCKKKRRNGKKANLDAVERQCRSIIHIQLRLQHTNGEICFRHHMFFSLASHLTCFLCQLWTLHILLSSFLLAMSNSVLFAFFISVCSDSGTIL